MRREWFRTWTCEVWDTARNNLLLRGPFTQGATCAALDSCVKWVSLMTKWLWTQQKRCCKSTSESFRGIIHPRIKISPVCFATLCGWRPGWHFVFYITLLGFHAWKEFHPMEAYGCHALQNKESNRGKTHLYAPHVVSSNLTWNCNINTMSLAEILILAS